MASAVGGLGFGEKLVEGAARLTSTSLAKTPTLILLPPPPQKKKKSKKKRAL